MDLQSAQTSILLFQSKKELTSLWKRFFSILEDLRQANKISSAEFQSFRKNILDAGNDAIRSLEEQIKQFETIGQGNQQEQGQTNDKH